MYGAEVAEVTFVDKDMFEHVVGIQALRGKALVVAGHGVRCFVAIGPDDFGPGRDRDLLRCNENFSILESTTDASGAAETKIAGIAKTAQRNATAAQSLPMVAREST